MSTSISLGSVSEALADVPAAELRERAWSARRTLGERAVILGHHYQKDEVMEFADITGDSFLLAQRGAAATRAELVVFLGVYFMAESAYVLAAPGQQVVLPDLSAGCHLAECADIFTVRDAWDQLVRAVPDKRIIPLTYMNSGADLKAFVGEHGGAVCTSGNAERAFRWARAEGDAILFFPDEHLGRNTGVRIGLAEDAGVVWDPRRAELGGIGRDALAATPLVLWKGFCNVHTAFTPTQVAQVRRDAPETVVIVHPECPRPVVACADEDGSTEYIIRRCDELPADSHIVIGTDWNLVNRLARQHPDKRIRCLNEFICPCVTMNRITLAKLTWCLEALAAGEVVNTVTVDDEMARWARVALDRMLTLA